MSYLPQNYLKQPGQWIKVRVLDVVVMLDHICRGAEHSEVGFEDANNTLDNLTHQLSKEVWLKRSDVESALWSCNLLDEQGHFRHPRGGTFQEWVKRLLRGVGRFNKKRNYIEDDKK